jgi:trans-L-3-hydroxyproline dehydratase
LRIITSGLPEIAGSTMLERRRWMQAHLDDVRKALMWEPRGHHNMYGCVVVPPVIAGSDLGVLFFHNEGYSTMCGHGVIALVTALLDTGTLPVVGADTPVVLDTPAGRVHATAHLGADGRVARVSFLNVPSFVSARDLSVNIPGIGTVALDVAFGGAFYAIVPAARVGLRVEPALLPRLVEVGEEIKRATIQALTLVHPTEPDLGFLYGTIFVGPPETSAHHSRNICIFADAEVDRSPTGTGVSARLAVHAMREELSVGQEVEFESILGATSVFSGRIVGATTVGPFPAIIPEISGTAHLTGWHEFVLDPHDTLGSGFLLP